MKDLTSIFSKSAKWDWALFLAYDYDPSFFEAQILHKIVAHENRTIVIDSARKDEILYGNKPKPRYTGMQYNLESVALKGGGSFHPKLYLFVSKDQLQLTIGSFNLTDTGFRTNLESSVTLSFKLSTMDQSEFQLLNQLSDFLEDAFVRKSGLIEDVPHPLRASVQDLLADELFVNVRKAKRYRSQACYFISSLHGSIFDQVSEIVGDHCNQVRILSPFFSDNLNAFRAISEYADNIDLYIPHSRSSFPADLYQSSVDVLTNINVHTLQLIEHDNDRFSHAKLYEFVSGKEIWRLVTSANFTDPGFFNSGFPRNLELGILYKAGKAGRFLDVPGSQIDTVQDFTKLNLRKSMESVSSQDGINNHMDSEGKILNAAYYDERRVVFTATPGIQVDRDYYARLMVNGIAGNLHGCEQHSDAYSFEPELEIGGSEVLKLVLQRRTDGYESLACPVSRLRHDPSQMPTLGASAFSECVRIGGFDGLQQAFNMASKSSQKDWLLYLLRHWDLEKIIQGLNETAAGDEAESVDMPSLSSRKDVVHSATRLNRNIYAVMGTYDLYERYQKYIEDVLKNAEINRVKAFTDYCFCMLLEITKYYYDILKREEKRKKDNPYIQYPEYTWGCNYKKYERYAKFTVGILARLNEECDKNSLKGQWIFSIYIKVWIEQLHTGKTLSEMDKLIYGFKVLRDNAEKRISDSLILQRISDPLYNEALELIKKYGGTEETLQKDR